MVSLAVTLIVSAAVLEVYVMVSRQASEASRAASLERDGQRLMDWFARDFSYFGNGVPRGCYKADYVTDAETASSCAASSLIPALRRADDKHLVFVGDLPLPNAELNGAVSLVAIKDNHDHDDEIAVSSDLSGCTPPKTAPNSNNYNCSTSSASLLRIGAGTEDCDAAHPNAVSCPWGLNKWFPATSFSSDVEFVIGYPSGQWSKRHWNGQDGGDGHLSSVNDYYGVHFDHGWPAGADQDISRDDLWKGSASAAWISHIDRVFYSLEGSAGDYTLYRRQCWGNLDSNDADWPNIGSNAMTSADSPRGCAVPDYGTGWEVLQRHIKRLSFRYFRDSGNELTGSWDAQKAAEARLVQVDLTVAAQLQNDRQIETKLSRRFFLKYRGGIIDDTVSHSEGGCYDSTGIHECIWD